MRYSQGDVVNTSLSRGMYYTNKMCSVCSVVVVFVPGSLLVGWYCPWHGHVLRRTQVIKDNVFYTNYISRDKSTAFI